MAEGYLAGDRPGSGGDRNLINLEVGNDVLSKESVEPSVEIAECGCVPAETARRMACDASIVLWKENETGKLDVGRKTRTIPPAIRRALERRDGGCAFPGCTCQYTDAHRKRSRASASFA